MDLRWLRRTDDRSSFSCGEPEFDAFIRKYAAQNQFRHRVGATIVAVEEDRVLGYATVAVGQIDADDLPPGTRGGKPRYPLPVLRLARLAVDLSAQHQGLGGLLLAEVVSVALRVRDELGCVAVVADVLVLRQGFYERLGFEPLRALIGRPPLPGTVPMFLSLTIVENAQSQDVGDR